MDATLPRTSVNKLIREVLPSGMRLTPDAREAVAECGLEFVQLVASVAHEEAGGKGRRIMMGAHILAALETLGYGAYRKRSAQEVELFNAFAASGGAKTKHKRQKLSQPTLSEAEEAEMALEQQKLFAAAAAAAAAAATAAATGSS
jgi:down-regulator of transcription 1